MTEIEAGPTLHPRPLAPLPLGTVRPAGWLRKQLEIQANGLTGHLDEFWPDVAESAWIGGSADGWERGPYWLDGLVPLAFLLGDDRLLEKAHRWVGHILDQQAEDGWFGTTADVRLAASGRIDLSHAYDPWPRFVLLKALTQCQEATGDKRIVPAMTRFLRRLAALFEDDPTFYLRSWGRYRWADLVVSIHWLHERTGEAWLLDLARTLQAQGFDWRTHMGRFPYRDRCRPEERDLSTHVVNNAMGIKAAGVWYRQSGDPGDRAASLKAIRVLDQYHGQATGVFSGDEHLAGRNPSQGTELCAVVEYMYSLETLLPTLGEPWLADRLEQIAYNALPATISPEMWTHQYVQQVNQAICAVDEDRVYTSNGPDANIFGLEPHFGCCLANMHQGWPKLAAHLWMTTTDGGLAAVAWGPCSVETEIGGVPVRVEVETDYPFDGRIGITVTVDETARFPLQLRIPGWAAGATMEIDGDAPAPVAAGGFHVLEREWTGTTTLVLDLSLRARLERRDGGSVSIHRGPLLFALPIGEEWRKIGGKVPHADWEIHPTTPWNYAIVLPEGDEPEIPFTSGTVGDVPYSPEGAPVSGIVEGRLVPGWGIAHNAAGPVPESPVAAEGPAETLRLIPYGSTNLRIAQFPVAEGPGSGG